MTKRGRKSAAELAIAAPVIEVVPRPVAPDHLTDDEAEVWEAVVACMAGDYFTAPQLDQLANMCRHIVTARRISAWVEKTLAGDTEGDIADVDQLLRMRERETRAANALARSLRLTKQSQISPKGAHGQQASNRPKPWDAP